MTPESDWKAQLGATVRLHEAPKSGRHRCCRVEARRVTEYWTPERPDSREYGVCPLETWRFGERIRLAEPGVFQWVDGSQIEVERDQ